MVVLFTDAHSSMYDVLLGPRSHWAVIVMGARSLCQVDVPEQVVSVSLYMNTRAVLY